ncbi:MAG: c-type cytochrome [Pirellulaceae bacterium]
MGPEVDAALLGAAIVFRNDETMLSAVFSSLDAENIDRIFIRLLDSADQTAVAELAPQFGVLVQRMNNAELAVSLAQRLVQSFDAPQIQAWHWHTLAFLLENVSAEATGSVLSGAWEESLQFAATDNDVALNNRLAAVDVLGATIELPAHRFVLQHLLSADAAEVRLAAIARLAADRNSQPWLASQLESNLPTSIRSVIIQQLLERKSALPFLKPVTDRHPDWFDQEQLNVINGSTAENISTLTGPLLEYRMDVLQRQGDAALGQAVYQKHCALCHESAADGQRTGPDLTALTNRTPTFVLDAVLLPSQAFDARYVTYNIDLKDGRRRTGLIREETSNSLTLVDVQNQVHVLLRHEMEAIESTGLSLMPSGLADQISPADMRNLLEYVTSHRR